MTRTRPARTALVVAAALFTALAASACQGSGGDGGTGGDDAAPVIARYVALGDSFTAAPFVPDSLDAEGCYRSTGNYPAIVARALGANETVDVSCSGADTTHLIRRQTTVIGQEVAPQLDALDEETDLVTLGIGGNDFNVFGTLTSRCPQLAAEDPKGAPCRAEMRRGDGDRLLDAVDRTERRVAKAVEAIRERSPEARILLVNYPQLTPAEGRCQSLQLARGDEAYAREVAERLDQALRRAAEASDAELVDLWEASEGHDICSDEPWVNGPVTDFSRALQFHPFAEGQQAAADLVLEALVS